MGKMILCFEVTILNYLNLEKFTLFMFGKLEIIAGGMFGSKTTSLILETNRYRVKTQVQIFSPTIDNRYTIGEITTHDGLRAPSENIPNSEEIINKLKKDTKVIGIDEITMFDEEILNVIDYLQNKGKIIIVSGLLLDFRGNYFPFRDKSNIELDSTKNMSDLIKKSPHILLKSSMCNEEMNGSICGLDTFHTQRYMSDGITIAPYEDKTIIIGKDTITETEKHKLKRIYKPKCIEHFISYK